MTDIKFNIITTPILFVFFALCFYAIASVPYSDIYVHIRFAQEISEGKILYPSNFLLYFLLNLFNGLALKKIAVSVILSSSVCLKYFLITKYFQSENVRHIYIALLALLFLFIFSIGNVNLSQNLYYIGSFTPTVWHNSTIIFLMPFCLLLYYYLTEKKATIKNDVIIFLLILINGIIKPSFLFVIIPFLCISTFYYKRNILRLVIYSVFAISLISIQYFLTYRLNMGSLQKEKSGVEISPLGFFKIYTRIRYFPFALILGYLFPIMFLFYNRKFLRNKAIIQAWVLVISSLFIFCFLIESGPRKSSGNFYWQIIPSSLILFLVTAKKAFLSKYKINNKKLLIIVFCLHIFYGCFYFVNLILFKHIF